MLFFSPKLTVGVILRTCFVAHVEGRGGRAEKGATILAPRAARAIQRGTGCQRAARRVRECGIGEGKKENVTHNGRCVVPHVTPHLLLLYRRVGVRCSHKQLSKCVSVFFLFFLLFFFFFCNST